MRDDLSLEKIIKELKFLFDDASARVKFFVVAWIILAILGPLVLLYLAIDQPIPNPDIKVSSLFSGNLLGEDITYTILQTNTHSLDVSASGEVFSLVTQVTGLDSYADAAELLDECVNLAKTTSDNKKEDTLLIPKGAIGTDFENIAVFQWTQLYETRLSNRSSKISHCLLKLDQNLIEVKHTFEGLSIKQEINIYRILSLE